MKNGLREIRKKKCGDYQLLLDPLSDGDFEKGGGTFFMIGKVEIIFF